MAFFSGALAISAMALPGISGSLVLILLGQYYVVLSAISALKHFSPDAAVFLASDMAKHITGEVIKVDGGQYI